MKKSIVVAVAENNVIGLKGKIPWRMPADLSRLKKLTQGNIAVLGMNTYVSMADYYDKSGRDMPAKEYMVLSDDESFKPQRPNAQAVKSFDEAFKKAKGEKTAEVFIIGGASIYKQAIEFADKIYLTKILHEFEGDTFFPELNTEIWKMVSCEKYSKDDKNPYDYEFCVFEKMLN